MVFVLLFMVIVVYNVSTKELALLFKLYGETLSEIIGHGVKALSYNIGKKVGRSLVDDIRLPDIKDAINYVKNALQDSIKIRYSDNLKEISIDYKLIKDLYGFSDPYNAAWLTFYIDGIVAGMLEKITNKKMNIKSDYDELSNKVLITGDMSRSPLEQIA